MKFQKIILPLIISTSIVPLGPNISYAATVTCSVSSVGTEGGTSSGNCLTTNNYKLTGQTSAEYTYLSNCDSCDNYHTKTSQTIPSGTPYGTMNHNTMQTQNSCTLPYSVTVYSCKCNSNCTGTTSTTNSTTHVVTSTKRACDGSYCSATNTYSCASGYCGNPTSPSGTCTKIPENAMCAGTQIACNGGYFMQNGKCEPCKGLDSISRGSTPYYGMTDESQCYIPANTDIKDSKGTYKFKENCFYKK